MRTLIWWSTLLIITAIDKEYSDVIISGNMFPVILITCAFFDIIKQIIPIFIASI